eukprot:TRINITY_DN104311_c0_g1_i1.p1 TRINITY_DN104311_c0_g1~~TRINITY_DN104311_c0_g1_i1.p1  ORF type:complete len:181 (-),score=21.81 TRINITY_DN104311_c0_g1_i1:41-583(-)
MSRPEVSQSLGTGDMADAELYLESCGVPAGLPRLAMRFGDVEILGSQSQFCKRADVALQKAPEISFDSALGTCTIVAIDPDAPDRVGDGSGPGDFGPWLHWLKTDCDGGSVTGGHVRCPYMGPAPPKGNHRYIFVLFQQLGQVKKLQGLERRAWNFPGFLRANKATLQPVAVNFFYRSSA